MAGVLKVRSLVKGEDRVQMSWKLAREKPKRSGWRGIVLSCNFDFVALSRPAEVLVVDESASLLSCSYNTVRSSGAMCSLDATWGLIKASNATLHQPFTCTSQSLCISSVTADSDGHYVQATCSFATCYLRSTSRPASCGLHRGRTMRLEEKQVLVDVYDKLRGETHSVLNSVIMIVSFIQENVHTYLRLSLISSILLLCRRCSSKFPSSNHFSNTFLHIDHSESIIEYQQESLFLPLTIWCCLNVPS